MEIYLLYYRLTITSNELYIPEIKFWRSFSCFLLHVFKISSIFRIRQYFINFPWKEQIPHSDCSNKSRCTYLSSLIKDFLFSPILLEYGRYSNVFLIRENRIIYRIAMSTYFRAEVVYRVFEVFLYESQTWEGEVNK